MKAGISDCDLIWEKWIGEIAKFKQMAPKPMWPVSKRRSSDTETHTRWAVRQRMGAMQLQTETHKTTCTSQNQREGTDSPDPDPVNPSLISDLQPFRGTAGDFFSFFYFKPLDHVTAKQYMTDLKLCSFLNTPSDKLFLCSCYYEISRTLRALGNKSLSGWPPFLFFICVIFYFLLSLFFKL